MSAFESLKSQLVTFRSVRSRADRDQDPDNLAAMQDATDFVQKWLETFLGREKTVLGNPRLSNVGKQEQVREVAQKAMGDLGPHRHRIEPVSEAMDRLKSITLDYRELPKGEDKLESLLLAQEVRSYYRNAPQQQKDTAFFEAASTLDARTMRAFLTAPGGRWVSDEFLRRADEVYGSKRNPDAWLRLQQLDRLHTQLLSLSRMIAIALLAYDLPAADIEKGLGVTLESLGLAQPNQPLGQVAMVQEAPRG